MNPAELLGRQLLLQFTERFQGHDLFGRQMNPPVISHAFDVENLIQGYRQSDHCLDNDECRPCGLLAAGG